MQPPWQAKTFVSRPNKLIIPMVHPSSNLKTGISKSQNDNPSASAVSMMSKTDLISDSERRKCRGLWSNSSASQ